MTDRDRDTEHIEPTIMPILNQVPHRWLMLELLLDGIQCLGGFPLWLIGGAGDYSDIDIYTNNWTQFYKTHKRLRELGEIREQTPNTTMFFYDGQHYQLVKPGHRPFSNQELLELCDMSAAAVILEYDSDKSEFVVKAMYPQDIYYRTCRVLVQHEWTDYRIKQYEKKYYKVIPYQSEPTDPI